MRIQKSFIGKRRDKVSACTAKKLTAAIEREAKRFGVSKSFVIANCIGYALNVKVEETYK